MKEKLIRGKSFTINKDKSIYGTFAEIGAAQETVNHFFKAGLASQTVAKSISAYDMIFSDEIYGKQSRYVCKSRLITMLRHEYTLLQKRLKDQSSKKCFFAFANTAATSSVGKGQLKPHYSWIGLRFQAKPQTPYNEVTFHVNCLDRNRLQQHEALGVLGVNLIYSCFYLRKDFKSFISSLMDNLHTSRLQISELTCRGPDFANFDEALINIELLNQNISPVTFFNPKGKVEFIADAIFKKDLILFHKEKNSKRDFSKELAKAQKASALPVIIMSKKYLKEKDRHKQIQLLTKNKFYLLISRESDLSKIKEFISSCTQENILIIISKIFFIKDLFRPSYHTGNSFLKSIGCIFDSKTTIKVSATDKEFSVKKHDLQSKENQIVNYLVSRKKILDI